MTLGESGERKPGHGWPIQKCEAGTRRPLLDEPAVAPINKPPNIPTSRSPRFCLASNRRFFRRRAQFRLRPKELIVQIGLIPPPLLRVAQTARHKRLRPAEIKVGLLRRQELFQPLRIE